MDRRCDWADSSDAMRRYHDHEWGVASHDDRHLFELLVLEGAQAGLSWAIVLQRRAGYREAFDGFDPAVVAGYDEAKVAALLEDRRIVRNRLKVRSAVTNAAAFVDTAARHDGFARYLWAWVDGEPLVNRPATGAEVPVTTPLAERVSRDLRRRGFTFVGPTIIYSYLQAVGVVNDHLAGCPSG